MVDGSLITAGIFTVDANGMLSENMFEIDADDLANATAYVLTIEPFQFDRCCRCTFCR